MEIIIGVVFAAWSLVLTLWVWHLYVSTSRRTTGYRDALAERVAQLRADRAEQAEREAGI